MKKKTRLGVIVGATRASSFVLGSIALGASNFLQVVGYVLVLVGLPEIVLVRSLRHEPVWWTIVGAITVFAASFLWVRLVSWLAGAVRNVERGRSEPPS